MHPLILRYLHLPRPLLASASASLPPLSSNCRTRIIPPSPRSLSSWSSSSSSSSYSPPPSSCACSFKPSCYLSRGVYPCCRRLPSQRHFSSHTLESHPRRDWISSSKDQFNRSSTTHPNKLQLPSPTPFTLTTSIPAFSLHRQYSSRNFSTSPSLTLSTSSTLNMATEYKLKDIKSLSDIPNYEKVESEVEGVENGKVLVVRLNDEIHALSPKCTHYGAPLKLGVVSPDGRITCPWHGGNTSSHMSSRVVLS
jgi:hypothetical protein